MHVTRPDGFTGRPVLELRGRDVVADAAGGLAVAAAAGLRLVTEPTGAVVSLSPLDGAGDGVVLPDLAGLSVGRGWSRGLAERTAGTPSLVRSLLEDLGGAFLVSGYAALRTGLLGGRPEDGARSAAAQADVCTGWAAGGPQVVFLATTGSAAVPHGPDAAASLLDASWPTLPEPAPGTVRRLRRLDVLGGDVLEAHLRDSYASDGPEMVMHEYLVRARLGPGAVVAEVAVEPRVLPWDACPGAVGSAQAVVGTPVADLPAAVRGAVGGPTSCTHLTSTLRALVDAADLLALP